MQSQRMTSENINCSFLLHINQNFSEKKVEGSLSVAQQIANLPAQETVRDEGKRQMCTDEHKHADTR